ncbi:MAG TPA: SDR family NAD(P)-dependent oxidoreductase [Symbiobacteriaceae bacterium]|jgi:polyketide synthase PksN
MGKETGLSEILRKIETGAITPEESLDLVTHMLETANQPEPVRSGDASDALSRAESLLKSVLSAQTKIPAGEIRSDEPFENYGIDSMMILELNRRLEKVFGELSKTLFFEYRNIAQLAAHFAEHHAEKLLNDAGQESGVLSVSDRPRFLAAFPEGEATTPQAVVCDDIAVIGVSGRYPMASNLQEFWQNLTQGKDCISEIPSDRWDFRQYYDPDQTKRDRAYAKWGGFIDDVDKFDPLFFNMSPREAETVDPQERLFLQTAYHTFEDAGYTRARLDRARVGVFVGVMYGQYQIYGTEIDEQAFAPTSSYASIANRASFFFNLQGPSMALDSMCSSSLTALHVACESLRHGESDMALAGGVNLSLHPLKYLILSQQRFAATDGRCRAFGEGGDGYVPGEGVGAVLLKPLRKALADGDQIYAVIKATAINHGGKTHGYSVPNPNAQAQVITEALEKSSINPRTISYIEAHGTGTSLGDPIEITGLTRAFGEFTQDRQFCAIGAVKSNIGHLEASAGIASLTKVLLQLRHKQLVPSLHSEKLNPHISFQKSPFYVQQRLSPWMSSAEGGKVLPRRAGVSAFGAGGTNVHVVLEEFVPQQPAGQDRNRECVIALSAQNHERLVELVKELKEYLARGLSTEGSQISQASLSDIAYTLQVGREAMSTRMALVASDKQELLEQLTRIAQGQSGSDTCFYGQDDAGQATLGQQAGPIEEMGPTEIARWWSSGAAIDWEALYKDGKPAHLSLPGYPFAKERCWVQTRSNAAQAGKGAGRVTPLHPLIDANESTWGNPVFRKTLTREMFVMKDHIVSGQCLLPGSAYLEIARAAGSLAGGNGVKRITDVVWARPAVLEGPEKEIWIGLHRDSDAVRYEVFGVAEGQKVVYCTGRYFEHPEGEERQSPAATSLDLEAIRQRCTTVWATADIYDRFRQIGFQYGPGFQVMEELRCGEWEGLATLRLPDHLKDAFPEYGLHPTMMDGAFRAALGIGGMLFAEPTVLRVPFVLGELEICGSLTEVCHAYAVIPPEHRRSDSGFMQCDITLINDRGEEVARLKGFAARPVRESEAHASQELLYYRPVWAATPIGVPEGGRLDEATALLLFDDQPELTAALGMKGIRPVQVRTGPEFRQHATHLFTINPGRTADYESLLDAVRRQGARSFQVIHAWNLSEGGEASDQVDAALRCGCDSMLCLVQAAAKLDLETKTRCVFAFRGNAGVTAAIHAALSGFARSLLMVNHLFELLTVAVDTRTLSPDRLARILLAELTAPGNLHGQEVRYQVDQRQVRQVEPVGIENLFTRELPFRTRGAYLITGGAGGLGIVVARYLAKSYQARMVLTGRSALDAEKQARLDELKRLGAEVFYLQADVTDNAAVQGVVRFMKEQFGGVQGVFHAAGVLSATDITQADPASFRKVLAPKVLGTLNLDEATQAEPLDFFVLFSSVSALVGDFGGCSYATANAFLDSYATFKEQLAREGKRPGRTISINWPMWATGGMGLPENEAAVYSTHTGMRALSTEPGLTALVSALRTDLAQLVVTSGDADKINKVLKVKGSMAHQDAGSDTPSAPAAGEHAQDPDFEKTLLRQTETYLKRIVAETAKVPPAKLDAQTDLEKYGIDSVMIMEISRRLEQDLGAVPKTIFFEYKNLSGLAVYLMERFRARLVANLKLNQPAEPRRAEAPWPVVQPERHQVMVVPPGPQALEHMDDVAIVGVSGRYPMAPDLARFWENLRSGKDCITEIPAARWDHSKYFDPRRGKKGKSYSKWGGFIDDVDKFDPLFFNISPREAALIDPQERLFMQTVWQAVEDAGYAKASLRNARVGVFVGAMYSHYQLHGLQENLRGNGYATSSFFSSIANRVSYFMDFKGPSLALDTACSSSLEALRLAYEHIRSGSCELAIAGGVNLTLHPSKYLFLCQGNFLSTDGRCHSFGSGGDGYVPGEGVGAVLLKPLKKAIADGDHIYAVIKGIAVNHGGRTNGFSVPSPAAQADLIAETLEQAGVHPRTVSFIEAHGTGTALGDPIEIAGLTKAFEKFTADWQFCAIGSAKSNIGHLESAAGVAGLTKILLQMQHKQLVPSLHSATLNPNITLEETPFYVQQDLAEWKRPVVVENGMEKVYPRRAGLSGFGAGGTNVHVSLEEYEDLSATVSGVGPPQLVVLSAQTEAALKEKARQLCDHLAGHGESCSLADVAYTLQVGREPMGERLAMIAANAEELRQRLEQFLAGNEAETGWRRGNEQQAVFTETDSEEEEYVRAILRKGNLEKIARLWVNGTPVDWTLLHGGERRRRVSLPGYPFARERCWVSAPSPAADNGYTPVEASRLHPLLDANESTLKEQTFTKVLSEADFVIRAHVVAGQPVLPGVAYLEMVRVAGELSGLAPVNTLADVVWQTPVVVERGEKTVHVGLYPAEDGATYQVYSLNGADRVVHSRGKIVGQGVSVGPERVDYQSILGRCRVQVSRNEIYRNFREAGFDYGPEFQVTDELHIGNREAISRLTLPASLSGQFTQFGLHPSLLDGALRTVAGLMSRERSLASKTFVPFSLGRLEMFRPLPERCYAYAVFNQDGEAGTLRFNLTILDEQGEVAVRLTDFSAREFKGSSQDVLYYQSVWAPSSAIGHAEIPTGTILVLDEDPERFARLEAAWQGAAGLKLILATPGAVFRKLGDGQYMINPTSPEDYRKLIQDLDRTGRSLNSILHLWNLRAETSVGDQTSRLDAVLDQGLYSLLYLFQAVSACQWSHRVRCILAFTGNGQPVVPWYGLAAGFGRSVTTVNHRFELITLQVDQPVGGAGQIASMLAAELAVRENSNGTEIRYTGEGRAVRELRPVGRAAGNPAADLPLKSGGVYLISGGAGGLGMILARHLAQRYQARLILMGRSAPDEARQNLLQELRNLGGEANYLQADVTKLGEVTAAVVTARRLHDRIDGVIHCAGVIGEIPVTAVSRSEFEEILGPKVRGTVHLDLATQGENLDFFAMFSSVAALLGDFGACSYASGNSFMDQYAAYREHLRRQGCRSGRTLSINWPLWNEGGMKLRGQESGLYFDYSGMKALSVEAGLAAWTDAWRTGLEQVIVATGDREKIERMLRVRGESIAPDTAVQEPVETIAPEAAGAGGNQVLVQQAERYLKEILAQTINLPVERIRARTELGQYGVDSVMIMEINSRLDQDFKHLPKTLMFEYNTLERLAGYFAANHAERLQALFGPAAPASEPQRSEPRRPEALGEAPARAVVAETTTSSRFVVSRPEPAHPLALPEPAAPVARREEDIAVVGLAGRYPMAGDMEQFWENLKHGVNCISEVPGDRWGHEEHYDAEKGKKGKAYSKWGGFISDVDKFDPLLFNISPMEAETMDPQERLFLEMAWSAFEDGGITRKEVNDADHRVGVFVGVMNCNYEWLGAVAQANGVDTNAHSAYWSIANRVSFFFNFQGPSLAVDSACSSSLTAIHLACESIKRGECGIALAGGVNLILHPAHYVRYSMMNMISGNYQCRSFGRDADGFVPGEGVGAVVLKPLSQAVKDGNHIYGVIKGSAINSGGRTNGYTVPNPNAQASLIVDALKKAEIDPRTISYLEAHGTGTILGDPIEVAGLTRAYGEFTRDKQYCAIGSAKSNIGHTEAAAGVAGLAKVLLQMKHRELAPSLHADELNPNIDFVDSPFYVQRRLTEWTQPVLLENGKSKTYPRRAGISSFGAGGANAHVIVEEYQPETVRSAEAARVSRAPQVVVLSARTEEKLKEYASRVAARVRTFLASGQEERAGGRAWLTRLTEELVSVAAEAVGARPEEFDVLGNPDEFGFNPMIWAGFTERLNQRYNLGTTAAALSAFPSLDAMARYLLAEYRDSFATRYADQPVEGPRQPGLWNVAYTLQVGRPPMKYRLALVATTMEELAEKLRRYYQGDTDVELLFTGVIKTLVPDVDQEAVDKALGAGNHAAIARFWAAGAEIDWSRLHEGHEPVRAALPPYPFERQRYWIPTGGGTPGTGARKAAARLHPLVDQNVSTFKEQRFSKQLESGASFMLQNSVAGVSMLPAAAFLEMARVAGEAAAERTVTRIQNVVWADPILVDRYPKDLQISLYPVEDSTAWFEVSSDARTIHGQGQICLGARSAQGKADQVDLAALRQRCSDPGVKTRLQNILQRSEWENKWSRKAVREIHAGQIECLAKLELPGVSGGQHDYVHDSTLLTAACQVAGAWLQAVTPGAGWSIPVSLREFALMAPLPDQVYTYLTGKTGDSTLTLHLLSENGQILATLTDLELQPWSIAVDYPHPEPQANLT